MFEFRTLAVHLASEHEGNSCNSQICVNHVIPTKRLWYSSAKMYGNMANFPRPLSFKRSTGYDNRDIGIMDTSLECR